jgi:hypothetical protein
VDLSDVAQQLYALPPGDFTAERNERAKELKQDDPDLAAQVKALARPTTAAWLVNQLVRHHGEEVEQVAQVGSALREAQEGLEKDQLRQLNKQRQAVLRAVTRQARALASELGHPVSTAIADEVEQTLRAVMSDPDAADAVRRGTLLKSLSGTGLSAVDLTDAVAVPGAGRGAGSAGRRRPSPSGGSGRDARGSSRGTAKGVSDELADRRRQHEQEERERAERERAERVLAEAHHQADEAEDEASRADDALDQALAAVVEVDGRHEELTQRLHELEQQVMATQRELAAVQREQRTAERDRDQARHESEAAHRALDRARRRVERLS